MRTYELRDPDALGPRSHPWVGTADDPSRRMLDLCAHPELIRTSLEDFRPFDAAPAVQTFYRLLEWMNGPGSALVSNDCAFTGPEPADGRLEASGRVMFLFRDLAANTAPGRVQALVEALARSLHELDPAFDGGALGLGRTSVRFTGLPPGKQAGHQVLVGFWAWGRDDDETLRNLDRVLQNLTTALRSRPRR